jgi:hypothetical protein
MQRIFYTLLLLLAAGSRLASQGICDSVVTIAPIQALCQGTGEDYLQASHPGGVWSGPGLIHQTNYLSTQNLAAGIYNINYRITGPGGCQVQATQTYQVLPANEAFAWVTGEIDCSNPNSTALLQAITFGNAVGANWSGQGEFFQGTQAVTGVAGEYLFTAFEPPNVCPQYAYANVPADNETPIQLVSCTDCSEPAFLKLTTEPHIPGWNTRYMGPNGATIAGFSDCIGIPPSFPAGLWRVEAKNPDNGCVSVATAVLNPAYAQPSVSAGSDVGLGCGFTPNLLSAMAPQSGAGYLYFWERPNGSTTATGYGALFPVYETGAYVLHGVNTFTGCADTDTAMVTQAATPVSSQISVICDGESLNGHTQSGNYVDTVLQANGCPIIQYTKLIVLAPLVETAVIEPDNGNNTGSISVQVVQGWGPFQYYWNTTEFTPTISGLFAGSYYLTITDANGCEHEREYIVPFNRPAVGKRDSPGGWEARVFPNPVSSEDMVQLQLVADEPGETQLLLTDALGRVLISRLVTLQAGSNTLPVAGQLPAGVYTLRLQGGAGYGSSHTLVVR